MSKTARKTRGSLAILLIFIFLFAGLVSIPLVANADEPLKADATWTVKIASIDIQKDVSPGEQVPDGEVTYTITVKNTGGADLHDVTVTDAMLGINENISDLAAGATASPITKTYTIPHDAVIGSTIVNTAEVIGYYGYDQKYLTDSVTDESPTVGERGRYVTDSDQAEVLVVRHRTPYRPTTPNNNNETIRVPSEETVTTPQQPPAQQPKSEPVVVPTEQPVAAPAAKGDLPKTGSNLLVLVLSGLAVASAGMAIRRRKD